jgi:hypothetical protein
MTSPQSRREQLNGNESLNHQLETCIRDLRQAKSQARQLFASACEELLSRRPSRESWSALECVAHLNLSSDAMLPGIKQAIAGTAASEDATIQLQAGFLWKATGLDP